MIANQTVCKKNKIIKKNKKVRKTSFKSYVKTLYRDVDGIMKKKRKKYQMMIFKYFNFLSTMI